jgi:transcriptional regulator with XRE-family HTH domain
MTELQTLAKSVRQKMKLTKLTQLDLANHTGLSVKTIRAIMQGKEGTAIKNWVLVAGLLGCVIEFNVKKMHNETGNSL